MIQYRAELHVHTVLSPCADVEMIPPFIIEEALAKDIQILAITDHNATANIPAMLQAAKGTGIHILPGMELQTREEVHLLCLFDTPDLAYQWQEVVDNLLPATPNNPEHFGEQFVVDAEGEFIRREERMLINSVNISIEDAVDQVHSLGGLAIPAHINRKAFGLLQILGFLPPGVAFDGLEISRHITPNDFLKSYPQGNKFPIIQSGDVHRLDEFLGRVELNIEKRNLVEIRQGLWGENGRNFNLLVP